MIESNGHLIVQYCGTATERAMTEEIEIIGEPCFSLSDSLHFVRLGSISRRASIVFRAFRICEWLQTIEVPSSARFLGDHCFEGWLRLEVVSFCPLRGWIPSRIARSLVVCRLNQSFFLHLSGHWEMHVSILVNLRVHHCPPIRRSPDLSGQHLRVVRH
jgi:hypothetical protein